MQSLKEEKQKSQTQKKKTNKEKEVEIVFGKFITHGNGDLSRCR